MGRSRVRSDEQVDSKSSRGANGRRPERAREEPDASGRQGDSRMGQLQCLALKCHNGKHIKSENNGDLRASSAVVKDAEKFDLTYHEDGRISLKCHTGKYLKVDKNGDVRGSGSSMEEESKFEVESHESGLISLRSSGGYVAAEANGRIRANRATVGAWEVFQVKDRSSKGPRTCSDPAQVAAAEMPHFYDAFCHLEDVLLAEERYAKTHADRTAVLFEKRAKARRKAGQHLSLKHFVEDQEYPKSFRGVFSAWDVTSFGDPSTEEDEGLETKPSWQTILEDASALENVELWSIFGIPCSSAAEAGGPEAEAHLCRLKAMVQLEHCKALGPVGVTWCEKPPPLEEEMAEKFGGMSAASILREFGASPSQNYDVHKDPAFLTWHRAGGTDANGWVLRHGDRRLGDFEAAKSDYTRRRLEAQMAVAIAQLELAKELSLPVILQVPPQDDAERSLAELLVKVFGEGSTHPMMLSSFHGRPHCVPAFMKSFPGMMVGFSGLLTHSKLKTQLGQVAYDVPMDRCLLESLGPSFPPADASGHGSSCGCYSHPSHVFLG